MARMRDPARDKAKEIYLSNRNITNREIANILGVDEKKIATWKYRDNWECSTTTKKNVVQQNDDCSTTNRKKLIKKAKAMVIAGNTLKETSEKVRIPLSTLSEYSSREKWIEKQEKYLENLHQKTLSQYEEQYLQDTKMSITLIHNLMVETYRDKLQDNVNFQKIGLRDGMINLFTKAMKAQSSLLGIISTDKMADINLKKMQLDLEKEKFIITSELKRLEILTKSDNINTTEEQKEDSDVDKNIEKWVDEVWK